MENSCNKGEGDTERGKQSTETKRKRVRHIKMETQKRSRHRKMETNRRKRHRERKKIKGDRERKKERWRDTLRERWGDRESYLP